MVGDRDDRIQKFLEIRQWCWQVWNASCELDNYLSAYRILKQTRYNDHWAWADTDYPRTKGSHIYLTGDQELAFFRLKWM
jgi:hypothetical protein